MIDDVPYDVMQSLKRRHWPGNIRELQNFIERAVIMSSGRNLRLPCEEPERLLKGDEPTAIRTLAETERDHILEVLRLVRGVVGGRNGAAVRLGLPRTTLLYRMRKLGVTRETLVSVGHATRQWDVHGAHTCESIRRFETPVEPAWLS